MRRNVIETLMGAVVLIVAAVFVVFALSSSGVQSVNGYEIVAEFDDASGITAGTDVRMSGVKIGSVIGQSLDRKTYFANVRMSIDNDIMLPADTSARIIPEGLLGGNYVALTPGGALENISPGGQIEHTQGAINLMDLLGRFIFSPGGDESPS
jgi:phospholipid/cholesterol/gamma-HCH transport system substrate-binding protein